MKKLKSKTFYTIFLILTLILIISIFIINYQSYKREYERIHDSLIRMANNEFNKPDLDNRKENLDRKIVIDYNIYTVILDSDNKISDTISHNFNKDIDINTSSIVNEVINKNTNDKLYIGNLYLTKYSYNYKPYNYITIVDNKNTNERLRTLLFETISLLIILEIIIFIISKKITNWIIKPALDSYNKQKEFIADASHELKTPLAIIMASNDSIKKDNTNEKWINNIKNETDRMNNLIKNLLDLSVLEEDNNIKKNNENLSNIITRECLTFETLAFEHELELEYNIEDNIIFNCNKVDIKELISILLDNAIKHSYKRKIIKLNLYKQKNYIILEVINEGKEIKEEERDKIFNRFYKIDKSRNRDSNNYGLGLAIAKAIVKRHNGTIEVNCKDGFTTFKVVFK